MGLADFATKKNSDSKNFPGPGQYNSGSTMGRVKLEHVTFKGRYKESQATRTSGHGTSDSVGPGKYNTDLPSGGPKFTIAAPTAIKRSKDNDSLGPEYTPRQNQMGSDPHGPQWSFGTKSHYEPRNQSGGGPDGEPQMPPEEIGHDGRPLPKWQRSVVGSTNSGKGAKIAGGGFGTTGSTARKVVEADEGEDVDPNGPGPARYAVARFGDKVPESKTVPVHYSKKQRSTDNVIGPGQYEIDHYTIGKKTSPRDPVNCKFGGRYYPPLPAPCGEPGPAAYEVSHDPVDKNKAKTFGKRFEVTGDLEKIYPKPGPGDYDLPSDFPVISQGAHGGGKGSSAQQPKSNKGFSFGEKLPLPGQSPRRMNDGPQDVPEIPQFSMATQVKSGTIKGARFSPRNQVFDKQKVEEEQKRRKANGASDAPGPASYDPKPVSKQAPSYSLTAREHKQGHLVDSAQHVPGPGTYDYKPPSNIKGFTFYKGSFADLRDGNENPGPGAYSDREAFASTKGTRGAGFSEHTPAPPPRQFRDSQGPQSSRY